MKDLISLKELTLSYTKKIEGLERLVNLKKLYIYNTFILKIEGLERLVNLETLELCGNIYFKNRRSC